MASPDDLPVSAVFDYDRVDTIIEAAALAVATHLGVSSGWEEDDSWQSDLVWWASAVNPVSGVKNLLMHGQWTQTTSGAQVVRVDLSRRQLMKADCYKTFWSYFQRCLAQRENGTKAAHEYLQQLIGRTQNAWAAINDQFEMARRINNDVCIYLNNALDNAYRIRTAASVAFMVVGSLPVLTATAAAGGVAAVSYTGAAAGSFTIMAVTSSPWVVAIQVAGSAAVYGFLTELAFNKDDVGRCAAAGIHVGDAVTGGATGAAGNLAQTGVEMWRQRGAKALADTARRAANRDAVRNAVLRTQAETLGRRAPPARMMTNEVQRRLSAGLAQHAEQKLNKVAQSVARSGSAIFIAYGLYSMRGEIKTAIDGLTSGIDRTR